MAKQPYSKLSEELIRAKAHLIYVQGRERGKSASPRENWQSAIDELEREENVENKAVVSCIGVFLTWPIKMLWRFLENETNREIAKIIISLLGLGATVAAAIGLYLNYQHSLLEREAARLERELSRKQLAVSEARQITDRFAKAVELLKDSDITVRIGALFALERLAKDSPTDHWTIMELLSRFVTEKSPRSKDSDSSSKLSSDVQAAITIIGRRKVDQDPKSLQLNLPNVNLSNAVLNNSDFSNAKLDGIKLTRADLSNANFKEAKFAETHKSSSSLVRGMRINTQWWMSYRYINKYGVADLSHANLYSTNLRGADLLMANLKETQLIRTNLSNSNLISADLTKATVADANFSNADLSYANLSDIKILGTTKFNNTDLREADLSTAKLSDSDLSTAKLCKTKLSKYSKLNPDRDCKIFNIDLNKILSIDLIK